MDHSMVQRAYRIWYARYNFKLADQAVEPFLDAIRVNGQLKLFREALFLPMSEMAEKLEISRAGYRVIERSEERKNIRLGTLMKVAEAMDCELVYCIRPKTRQIFSQVIWNKLIAGAEDHFRFANCRKGAESHVLAAIARDRMNDPAFRREQRWSQRRS